VVSSQHGIQPPFRPEAKAAILRAVQDQLESPESPEVQLHYQRLISLGYSDTDSRNLIATVLLFYLNDLAAGRDHTYADYVANLERLPEVDWSVDETS